MGDVWTALDTRLDRTVALKTSAERFSDRFANEARIIASLNHPNICTLFDVGPDFLVMEYIDGKTLDRLIPRKGMNLGDALHYAIEIVGALCAAHACV
ncbi:MAG: eukaryotic-like serine/threonine-protein kinase [Bryobacterales bacterium]|nr:eukaryotic-like serine/threonine-protein kinase [Bryobacterales bacterium]